MPDIWCIYTHRQSVSIVSNLALLLFGSTLHWTTGGFTCVMIVSKSYQDIPGSLSVRAHTDHHMSMPKYHSNSTSEWNWFELAVTPCLVLNLIPTTFLPVLKPYLQQLSEKNLWNNMLGMNWLFCALRIYIGQRKTERAEVWTLSTQRFENIG